MAGVDNLEERSGVRIHARTLDQLHSMTAWTGGVCGTTTRKSAQTVLFRGSQRNNAWLSRDAGTVTRTTIATALGSKAKDA